MNVARVGFGMGGGALSSGGVTMLAFSSSLLQTLSLGGVLSGTPRALLGWTPSGFASPLLAIGTNSALYVFTAGEVVERTPMGPSGSEIISGLVDSVYSLGVFGGGVFGGGVFGEGDISQGALTLAARWQMDVYNGNTLVCVLAPSDGQLLSFEPGVDSELQTIATSPTANLGVVVTSERFVVALGAGGDPRRVEWASQETMDVWTPAGNNTAGGFTLPGSGVLRCGRRGKNETLLFTSEDLFALQYVGGTLVYSLAQLGTKCGLISDAAVAVIDGRAAWMGEKSFFVYDGFVQPVPSDVSDYVFSNFNTMQKAKCFAQTVAAFGEVWFFYPSGTAMEPDRYVIWNYRENHWTPGYLSRTAGIDAGAFEVPVMIGATGVLYKHETGTGRGSVVPYLESGPIELGDGESVLDLHLLIPDEATIRGQELGSCRLWVYSSMYPSEAETTHGPYTLANPTSLRITARQVRLRLEEVTAGDWRVGDLRLDVTPGGRR
jgi:hypothetical protein